MGIEQDFVVNKRVLVMGVSGMFGRGLSYVLTKNNEVYGLGRFPSPEIKEEVSQWCEELWDVDVSQPGSLRSVPDDFDVVFNEIVQWNAGGRYAWDSFRQLMLVNSLFPGHVMEHFAESGARMVFGSTGGVYLPSKDRNDLIREGVTGSEGGYMAYDDTKLGGEMLVNYFSIEHQIPAVILRYFWPAAPYTYNGRASSTCCLYLQGKPSQVSRKNPWYYNVGYISDLIYATIAAANRVDCPAPLYNVAGKNIASFREVDEAVAEELGMDPIFEEVEKERDLPMYLADVRRMSQDLWEPRIGLRECVRRCVRAVKEEANALQDWMFEC